MKTLKLTPATLALALLTSAPAVVQSSFAAPRLGSGYNLSSGGAITPRLGGGLNSSGGESATPRVGGGLNFRDAAGQTAPRLGSGGNFFKK